MSYRKRWNIWYPPTSPKEVKGGIKAKNKKGTFAETWWGKRWVQALESFRIGARLSRGKSYARRGQVLEIDIEKGFVAARVQGSISRAYEVEIAFEQWDNKTCNSVIQTITDQAVLSAGLLGGEMPMELEEILSKQKIDLFPRAYKDIKTSCSCPDWSNPCKHIAAVAYLLASEFDRDPFLILKLRGLDREELLLRLRTIHGDNDSLISSPDQTLEDAQRLSLISIFEDSRQSRPDIKNFWMMPDFPENLEATSSPPPVSASVIKRLGCPPLWRSEQDFQEVMDDIYQAFSAWAEEWLS